MMTGTDYFFLIDSSMGTTDAAFKYMIEFVLRGILAVYQYYPNARAAIINYGGFTQVISPLVSTTKFNTFSSVMGGMQMVGGVRRIDLALRKTYDDLFRESGAERGKHVVLLTSGKNGPTGIGSFPAMGAALQKSGAVVTVLGVGGDVDMDELKPIKVPANAGNMLSANEASLISYQVPFVFKDAAGIRGRILKVISTMILDIYFTGIDSLR